MTLKLISIIFCFTGTCVGAHERVKRQSQPVVCGQPLYTGAISETALPGTFILRASATDTAGNALTWSIPDTALKRFAINPSTGDVSVSAQLARTGARSALEIRIRASETNNAANYCEAVVRINILPVTATPVSTSGSSIFGQSSYSFTATTCTAGLTIGQVFATSTTGQVYTYSIPSGNSYFSVNPTTGLVTLLQIPPSGTQTFSVTATSTSGQTGTVPVTVTSSCSGTGTTGITFGQTSYTFTQPCTLVSGTFVGSVSAFSTSGGTITYQLISGNGLYTINPTTGQITSLTTSSGTQTLQVQAISSTGQTGIVPVTIVSTCSGTSTGAPTFSSPFYTFTPSSCVPGGTVGQVVASSSGLPVTYILTPSNSYFSVNPTTGLITVIGSPPIGLAQTFQVQAISSSGQSAVATVSITGCTGTTTGTTTPVFQQSSYVFTATTCTPGVTIGQVFATALGATVTYTGTSPYFSVNPTTGQITAITTPPAGVQTLQVQAFSSNGLTATVPVTITAVCSGIGTIGILGTVPTFSLPIYTLSASSCTSGASVGSVTATSSYGTPIYSIDSGNQYYAINPSTGQITVLNVPASGLAQTFNVRATANGYSSTVPVTVTATCSGTGTGVIGTGTGVIGTGIGVIGTGTGGVTFGQPTYTFTTTSCTTGSQVGQVTATSSSGGIVNYSQGTINSGQYFINPNTGAITVASQLFTGASSTLTITGTSTTGQTGTTTVTIIPTCTQQITQQPVVAAGFNPATYTFSLSTCTAGTTVGSVVAVPPAGATLTYSLTGSSAFAVNPQTGLITVIGTPSASTSSFTINALASTGMTATASVTVTSSCTAINVINTGTPAGTNVIGTGNPAGTNVIGTGTPAGTNVIGTGNTGTTFGNRLPPIFNQTSYQCTVQCSSAQTTRACVVLATNSQVDSMNYLLTPTNQFYVDTNSGEIRTIQPIRTGGTFSLIASATDPYGNTASAPVTVTIAGSC